MKRVGDIYDNENSSCKKWFWLNIVTAVTYYDGEFEVNPLDSLF